MNLIKKKLILLLAVLSAPMGIMPGTKQLRHELPGDADRYSREQHQQ